MPSTYQYSWETVCTSSGSSGGGAQPHDPEPRIPENEEELEYLPDPALMTNNSLPGFSICPQKTFPVHRLRGASGYHVQLNWLRQPMIELGGSTVVRSLTYKISHICITVGDYARNDNDNDNPLSPIAAANLITEAYEAARGTVLDQFLNRGR